MKRLSRFDIAEYGGVTMVVIESDLLASGPAIMVIPLLPDYPSIRSLNPEIRHEERRLVLAKRPIPAARQSTLRPMGNAADQADEIARAVDILMNGR